jgi:excinuclease ABC subunit C
LKNKIKYAPKAPGVYLMKDKDGNILYVGKSKELRSRIRAYFVGTDTRFMTPFLVSKVHDVEFIVTKTEKEALILENTLIKEHHPRYNVNFRDDKNYFQIRINLKETFPRFNLARRPLKDGARYFGPYPSSASAKETLQFLQKIFPLRTCRDAELKSRSRPCLEYEIGRCLAPCVCLVDETTYHQLAKDGVTFLEGKEKGLLSDLRCRMNTASEKFDFEQAAVLRDRIVAIVETLEKQQMVSVSPKDQDVFGIAQEEELSQVCVLFIRKGKLLGKKSFPLIKIPAEPAEILSSVIKQYYDGEVVIPDEIFVPLELEDQDVVMEWLSEKKGVTVTVMAPRKGRGWELLSRARQNSENTMKAEQQTRQDQMKAIDLLARALQLKKLPVRIECFDISNLGGAYAVGSMVTFVEGKPYKDGYRRFRIKRASGMDDYGMMYEVLTRRNHRKDRLPDLIMVDGGKGQLGVARSVLKDLAVMDMDVVGLAKEGGHGNKGIPCGKTSGIYKGEDRVYLPHRKDPLYLSKWPGVLLLLQQIRDEAHRFALSYHRRVREQADFQSVLDEIPGIGASKKKALLTYFGDVTQIREASLEKLQAVDGIGKALAGGIYTFLRNAV